MVGYFVGKDPGPGIYVAEYVRADLVKELEAKLAKAEARLKKECGFFVHCYWDANDREIGHFDICEILDAYDFGTVAEIEHVAVIAKTFEAQLPPADDSETDDLFEVCEHTQEAAEAKVAAEISRRATLAELKGETDD